MNASLTIDRSDSVPWAGHGSRPAVRRGIEAFRAQVNRSTTRQRVVALSVLTAVLVAVVGVVQGPVLMGYLGVFVFSALANAILFLPSGRGAVMLAGAVVLNPLAVAVLTGMGGAVGEITGYALGRTTRNVGKNVGKKVKVPSWLSRGLAARPRII